MKQPDRSFQTAMNVLVYIDNRPTASDALTLAVQWIEHVPSQITLVAAGDSGVIEAATQRLVAAGHPPVESKVEKGRPVEIVCAECASGTYDLVIAAPAGYGPLERLLHRSRIGRLVHHLDTSVLIARQVSPLIRKILVGVGTGAHALVGVKAALRLARAFQAEVTLLHVVSQVPLMFSGLEHMQLELESYLTSGLPGTDVLATARALATDAGPPATVCLRQGLVRDEIVHEAGQAGYDLLLIGAHARQGWAWVLLDDIADHVVHASPISTLVLRGEPGWAS